MDDPAPKKVRRGFLASLGPAIIVASVVLGPGSILANSRVGWQHGYEMAWVLVVSSVLMIGMTALSMHLGVGLRGTLCETLARNGGRWWAALIGLCIFLVAGSFQFGNNLGVLFAVEPFLDDTALAGATWLTVVVLCLLNGAALLALFGLRTLYGSLERLMKVLVGLMILGFVVNVVAARPSLLALLAGLLPGWPEQAGWLPHVSSSAEGEPMDVIDPLWPVQALIGTTFSVAGAFYHSYLVRQKGWGRENLREGLRDAIVGIATLGVMSLLIMVTAAAVLHDKPEVTSLNSAADVARQLDPFFGTTATVLFCLGIFAGAFSSFLVNAIIGGTMLADGLGKGGGMEQRWPKRFTACVLVSGMAVAIGVKAMGLNTGNLIIFAQAITVVVNPLLAGALLRLARLRQVGQTDGVPRWIETLAWAGFGLVLLLSVRTGYKLWLEVMAR